MRGNPIFSGVFIGDQHDAMYTRLPRLCLIEDDEFDEIKDEYEFREGIDKRVPLLEVKNNRTFVPKDKLEAAADFIDAALREHGKVLVHCVYGMERSPLAVVYWLHKRNGFTWEQAYRLVKRGRKIANDCTDWLKKPLADECGARYQPQFYK